MRVLVPILFLLLGVRSLWVAITGKTVYYGRLGVLDKSAPAQPMPPRRAKWLATMMGLGFLLLSPIGFFS